MGCLRGHSSPILQPQAAGMVPRTSISDARDPHWWQLPKWLDFTPTAPQGKQPLPTIPSIPLLTFSPLHRACGTWLSHKAGDFCFPPQLPKPQVLVTAPCKLHAPALRTHLLKRNVPVPERWMGAEEQIHFSLGHSRSK